ncbi:MAG: class I SAM-dependent methyltransferase [Actinomycetota bacterium]
MPEPTGGSVAFDRAAGFYDQTRALSPQAAAAVQAVLTEELGEREPILEIGVGTGRIALPLVEAGVPVVGVDLSEPMLAKLREKSAGSPFPLVQGDATRLPFRDDAFGAAYGVHVLHLIPGWRDVVAELMRTVRGGGRVLIDLGGMGTTLEELSDRLASEAGTTSTFPGLGADGGPELDAEFARHGARARELAPIEEVWRIPIGAFITFFEGAVFSWTWGVSEERRKQAADAVRPWAEERFGSLDEPVDMDRSIRWRAYDLLG